MSELNLSACPICHAADGLSRRVYKLPDKNYVSYECRACGSALLWLGGQRWAYQKVGVASMAHLNKRPMTVAELHALLPVARPKPDASARPVWRDVAQVTPEIPARDLPGLEESDTPDVPAASSTWSTRDPAAWLAGSDAAPRPKREEPPPPVWEPSTRPTPDEGAGGEVEPILLEGPIRRGAVERSIPEPISPSLEEPPKPRRGPSLVIVAFLVVLLLLLLAAAFVVGLGLFSNQPATPTVAVLVQATETTPPRPTETIPPPPTDTIAPRSAPTLVPTLPPAPTELRPTAVEVVVPPYEILQTLNISDTEKAKGYLVKVETEFPVSYDQVKRMCREVVSGLKEQGALLHATIEVYDPYAPKYSGVVSIGKCFYAPAGYPIDVTDFPGSYQTYDYSYTFQAKLADPQAALGDRPPPDVAALCNAVSNAMGAEEITFDVAAERIAGEQNVDKEAVLSAYEACLAWADR
jgi:hypothetical protein